MNSSHEFSIIQYSMMLAQCRKLALSLDSQLRELNPWHGIGLAAISVEDLEDIKCIIQRLVSSFPEKK